MSHAADRICRYRVDVIGLQKNANFSQFVVDAESPEEAIAKVGAATGARRLKAHPITTESLLKGWLAHIADQVRLFLNI